MGMEESMRFYQSSKRLERMEEKYSEIMIQNCTEMASTSPMSQEAKWIPSKSTLTVKLNRNS